MRYRWLLLLVCFAGCSLLHAEDADNLARIHVEAIGGKMRLNLLQSLRVQGNVMIDGRYLEFSLLAQRPNRIRMETRTSEHTIVQATDGVNPPWQMDPQAEPLTPRIIAGKEALEFSADAEFDDPLVDYESKGYTVDYAGTISVNGRRLFRLLITRRNSVAYHLLLDAETYFIAGKQAVRDMGYGREVKIETWYEDFRPVGGVIMPHRIRVTADGKPLHETVLQKVEPNVAVPTGIFTMPVVVKSP
jgi:hypothetical protein